MPTPTSTSTLGRPNNNNNSVKKKKKDAAASSSSSSSNSSIKVLICTANLGNAKPDASSWDAWIPKHGRIDDTTTTTTTNNTRAKVLMTPPSPAPPVVKRNNNNNKVKGRSTENVLSNKEGGSNNPPSSSNSRRKSRSSGSIVTPVSPTTTTTIVSSSSPKTKKEEEEDSSLDEYEQWLQKQQQLQSQQEYVINDDDDDDFHWVPPPSPSSSSVVVSSPTEIAASQAAVQQQQLPILRQATPSSSSPPHGSGDRRRGRNNINNNINIINSKEKDDSYEQFLQHLQMKHHISTSPLQTKEQSTTIIASDEDDDEEEDDEEEDSENDSGDDDDVLFPLTGKSRSSFALEENDGHGDQDDEDGAGAATITATASITATTSAIAEKSLPSPSMATETIGDEHSSFPAFAFDEEQYHASFANKNNNNNNDEIDDEGEDAERFSLAPPKRKISFPTLELLQPLSEEETVDVVVVKPERTDDTIMDSAKTTSTMSTTTTTLQQQQQQSPLRGRRNGNQDTKKKNDRKSTATSRSSKSRSRSPTQNMMAGTTTTTSPKEQQQQQVVEEYFDMIVIGMQEATFDLKKHKKSSKTKSPKPLKKNNTNNNAKEIRHSKNDPIPAAAKPKSMTKKKKRNANGNNCNGQPESSTTKIVNTTTSLLTFNDNPKHQRLSTSSQHSISTGDDLDWDEDDSLSSSDDEEVCILHDDGTVTIVDDYTKLIRMEDNNNNNQVEGKVEKSTTSKGLKKLLAKGTTTTAKTLVKVGYTAGKVGLQAGKAGYLVSKKVGKAAETANRYAGYGKDHTLRQVPAAIRVSSNATALDDKNGGGWTDTDTIHYRLEAEQIPGYQRALSYQFGEMRLMVYVRLASVGRKAAAIKTIDIESVKYQATGIGGVLANKGGIVAEVLVNHNTRLSFLSAHLEAHEGESHFNARCTSFQDILMGAGHKYYDASQSSHYSFCMGDLNFRTRLTGVSPERHLQMTHKMAANQDWRILNQYDELQMALATKKCLWGYQTPYCNFAPTFKVLRQDGYHYNIKRSPSYTDRILFKSTDQLDPLVPFMYEGVEQFVSSDHKPIRSAFEIPLNPSLKWKPATPAKGLEPISDKKGKGVKPKLTAARETMHFFISDIRCVISSSEYDRLKKCEKADAPSPVLLFVTNPNSAIIKDDAASKKKIWSKLGLKNPNSKSSKKKANTTTPTDSSSKYPSTSVQKDTLRPNWGKESVHFTVNTHNSTGEPVFLSASMLHFCLRDSKQAFMIGSYALNLAKLVAISREGPAPSTMNGGNGGRRPSSMESSAAATSSYRRGSSGGFTLAAPSNALLSAGAGGSSNEHVQRASLTLNPRQANSNNLIPTSHLVAKSFQQTLLSRKGSVRHMGRGPSKSLMSAMMEDGDALNEKQGREKLRGLNVMSLRLDETLIGGGLELGSLKCSIDVWWTQDDE